MEKRITFYRDQKLGSGTWTVYRGTLQSIGGVGKSVDVAVKRILIDYLAPEYMRREIEHLISLDHPNVVQLLHHQYDADFLLLALSLCDASLHEYCSKTLEEKYYSMLRPPLDMLLQMARGLEHIHSNKLVHRNIKPSNILILSRGDQVVLKISDFGFSKETSSSGGFSRSGCKETERDIFMAPELFRGNENATGRSDVDIFALGCVFYCFLTTSESRPGKHPFGPIDWVAPSDADRIKDNIRKGKSELSGLEHGGYKSLVEAMIREKTGRETDCRPNIQKVVQALLGLPSVLNVLSLKSYSDDTRLADRMCNDYVTRLVIASSDSSEFHKANSVNDNVVTLKSYLEDTKCVHRMCNDYVALLQMAQALESIHSKNMAHGDIKPENIAIREGNNGVVLQLSTMNRKARNSIKPLADDVSDLGLVFIQYLMKSLALSPAESNEANVKRLEDRNHWAVDVVRNMICEEPDQRLNIGQVVEQLANLIIPSAPKTVEHQIVRLPEEKKGWIKIGQGNHPVYRGQFSNKDVAVKRISIDLLDIEERETRNMMHLEHPNVLQLLYADKENEDFLRLILELCDGNLRQLCHNELDLGELVIDDRDGLVQMAKGLEYIHGQNLVHRDVKPDNILVKRSHCIIYKISDFDHTKRVSFRGTYSMSGRKGTPGYVAPEWLEPSGSAARGTTASDVFTLGIVFHFFLPSSNGPRGEHPFNLKNSPDIEQNIKEGKFNIAVKEPWVELIKDMIQKDPKFRPKLLGIIHRLRFVAAKSPIVSQRDCCGAQKGNVLDCAFDQTKSQLVCALNNGMLAIFQGGPDVPFKLWSRNFFQVPSVKGIFKVAWNMDGNEIATGCGDSTDVVLKRSGVCCIEWNPYNPKLYATGSRKGTLQVWDVSKSYSLTNRSRKVESWIEDIAIWSVKVANAIEDIVWINSQGLVTRTSDGRVQLWEIGENSSTSYPIGGKEKITGICWNGEDQQLATCSRDVTLTIWDLKEEITRLSPLSLGFEPRCIDWYRSAEKSMVAIGGYNGALKMIFGSSLNMFELKMTNEDRGTIVTDVSFSPNGQYLAAFYRETKPVRNVKVTLWFTGSIPMQRVFEHQLSCETFHKKSLNWSPTSQRLAIAQHSHEVVVLEIPPEP